MNWNEEGRLNSEDHARVFKETVVPRSDLPQTTPQQHPKAVVLAGQPGAGKGGLAKSVKGEFSGNIVPIDPDELRRYHPQVDQFRKSEPYTWSDKTHHDASQWAKELRQAAVEGRRNVLVDTTLGNADSAVQTIKDLQAKGYEAEIRVVATHRLESELGVDERFTKSLDKRGYGRYVPEEARAKIYEALPGNLDKVQAQTGVRIRIYSREGQELYDSHASSLRPGAALEQAREARMQDPALTRDAAKGWRTQQRWHEDLPENLERNPKISPDTAQKTLEQHSDLKVVEGVNANTAETIATDRAVRIEPGAARVRMGLKVAGAAAMAYDAVSTGLQAKRALDAGNTTAAQSSVMHFGTRNLGMMGGAAAFSAIGAAAGVETGPGAFLTGLAGGVVGAVAGDKIADAIDHYRIYNQTDPQGNTWEYNPNRPQEGWTRQVQTGELDPEISAASMMPVYKTETLHADPELSNRLTCQASSAAVELALPKAPEPQDPYVQASADNKDATAWMRDAQTRAWSRTVIDNPAYYYAPDQIDLESALHRENASPEQAAQLDKAAHATIEQNLANSPQGMAQRYQQAYEQNGWSQYGPMPKAVEAALHPPDNEIRASDGHTYTQGPNGQWTTPGTLYGANPANQQVRQQLDATREQRAPHKASPESPRQDQPASPKESPRPNPKPNDPRDPKHPEHAMYQSVSEQLAALNGTRGIVLSPQQLDNCSAAIMAKAREVRIRSVNHMEFSADVPPTRVVFSNGDPDHPASKINSTDMAQAIKTPAEQSFLRFEQNTQAFDQWQQQMRQQRQAEEQSQGRSMSA